MSFIRITKRRFGSSLSRVGALFFGPLALLWIFVSPGWLSFIFGGIYAILASVYLFGKEIVEIDFEENSMLQYTEVFFSFLKSKKQLPEIDYILVRDFYTSDGASILTSSPAFYELSFVLKNKRKIILAFCSMDHKINSLVKELQSSCSIPVKDGTKFKVLKLN